jgi:ferritin-like protein
MTRVETKMHFSVFAKRRKSGENGQIVAKYHEISFCENISFPQKFLQKRKTLIFAKLFAKIA